MPLGKAGIYLFYPYPVEGQTEFFSLGRRKTNFKPVILNLEIGRMSQFARSGGVG